MVTVEYNIKERKTNIVTNGGDMMPGTSDQIILFRNKYLDSVNTLINIARDNAKEINSNGIKVKFESDEFKAVKAKYQPENNKILIDFEYIG